MPCTCFLLEDLREELRHMEGCRSGEAISATSSCTWGVCDCDWDRKGFGFKLQNSGGWHQARSCKAYNLPCQRLLLTVGPKYKELVYIGLALRTSALSALGAKKEFGIGVGLESKIQLR